MLDDFYLRNISDGVVLINYLGLIVGLNPAAERIFDRKEVEVGGKPISILLPFPYNEIPLKIIKTYLRTRESKLLGLTRELKGVRKDGSVFSLEVSLGKLGSKLASPSTESTEESFVAIMRDTTVPKQTRDGPAARNTAANLLGANRYQTEFEEQELLGFGGFGSVYKCLNRLDDQHYAIKKVYLRLNETTSQELNEVKLLASITNHPNIVRYYTSWVEYLPQEKGKEICYLCSKQISPSELPAHVNKCKANKDDERIKRKHSYSVSSHKFSAIEDSSMEEGLFLLEEEISLSHSSELSIHDEAFEGISDNYWKNREFADMMSSSDSSGTDSSDRSFGSSSSESHSLLRSHGPCSTESDDQVPNRDAGEEKIAVLYIQMQLYESSTLAQWLDNPQRTVNRSLNLFLFSQLVNGLHKIHSHGIIHRDLKPSNIFMDGEQIVKIGDFGLATTQKIQESALASLDDVVQSRRNGSRHTAGVGTAMYASPEQLRPQKSKNSYNEKADIYALGVILVEMFCPPFTTQMERVCTLSQLRGNPDWLPQSIVTGHPEEALLMRAMLATEPDKRPSTEELMRHPLLDDYIPAPSSSCSPTHWCRKCEKKQQTVESLSEELREKDKAIVLLSEEIRKLQDKLKARTNKSSSENSGPLARSHNNFNNKKKKLKQRAYSCLPWPTANLLQPPVG